MPLFLLGLLLASALNLTPITVANRALLADADNALVLFFSPYCPHCQRFRPTYLQLGTKLNHDNLLFADVDCTVERPLCAQFKIRAYPTVLFVSKGLTADVFRGPRTVENLLAFVENNIQ